VTIQTHISNVSGPRISIVTVNLNNDIGLTKTIESVVGQTYRNIEYIIIDGASTDESVRVIKTYETSLSFWISEKDSGIYNGMNKGLLNAAGDYILFLNSGDYLASPCVIYDVVVQLEGEDVIYGNIGILNSGRLKVIPSARKIEYYLNYQHNLPPHPAIFARLDLVRKLGGFDEQYKVIADVALISRIFKSKNLSYKYLDILVTIFDTNGVSSDKANSEKIYQERKEFLTKEFPHYLPDFEKIYRTTLLQKLTNLFS
jgi:glycosyltransferase involved in cell wall biosynthesis